MWSILENVPCAFEKKVYSSAFGWNILKISMRSISSNVLFKTYVFLLLFCFDDLSFGVSGVLKSPITVLLSISPFMFVTVFALYFEVLLCWVYAAAASESLQSCLTLCDPIDGSPPGSSVPGILQARILEWVAISFSNACVLSRFSRVQLCATP